MNILVLGLGNILLADEGVGVHAVQALDDRYDLPEGVEVVDGGTTGMDLLDIIAGRDHVIVVDAVAGDDPPGTTMKLTGDAVPAFFRTRISPHQLGLSDVLATLHILGSAPQGLTLIGIRPDSIDMSLELSPLIAAKLDEVVGMIVAELEGLGQPPVARAGPSD